MLVESVSVKNFKIFGDFSVEGLKRFTLVGGDNGCGKTTLLEAVVLCFSQEYGKTLLPIMPPLRDISIFDDNAFAHLSHGGEFNAPITVSCAGGGVCRGVKIAPTDSPSKPPWARLPMRKNPGDVLETSPVKRALADYTQNENLLRRVTISLHKGKFESFVHSGAKIADSIGLSWILFVRNGGLA